MMAGGVVAGAGSTALVIKGGSAFDDYERDRAALANASSDEYATLASKAQNSALRVQRYDYLAIGSGVVAAGLIGTGLVLLLTDSAASARPRASLAPNEARLEWSASF